MKTLLTWRCPLCKSEDAVISRGSQDFLDMAVGAHILTVHEEKAAMKAVDRARIECPHQACEIGRKAHQNISMGTALLPLTDFDKSLLRGMKIGIED